jgi:rhamnulokinase
MQKSKHIYLGFDLGASSGRAIVGILQNRRLAIEEISRFPNVTCRLGNRLHWNVLSLWNDMLAAMRLCAEKGYQKLSGIGVDTWGVDFGLLGPDDILLANPICYRDPMMEGIEAIIRSVVDEGELYQRTG